MSSSILEGICPYDLTEEDDFRPRVLPDHAGPRKELSIFALARPSPALRTCCRPLERRAVLVKHDLPMFKQLRG